MLMEHATNTYFKAKTLILVKGYLRVIATPSEGQPLNQVESYSLMWGTKG